MALEDYLRLKNKLLGFELTTKEDLAEIESWDEKTKKEVTETIRKNINELPSLFPEFKIEYNVDAGLCPWCIIRDGERCKSCNYRKRNGKCDLPGSRYNECLKKTGYKYTAYVVIKNMTVLKKSLSLK